MSHIILQYQVPHCEYSLGNHCKTTYEVKTLQHSIDPAKSFRDNLNDAFVIACKHGADPNKCIRWKTSE